MRHPATPSRLSADHFRRSSPARVWNYLLGGKDNYPVDRTVGDALVETTPDLRVAAQQSRRFLQRAVTWVTSEAGIRQLIDVGCGLPAPYGYLNTHEIAQQVNRDTKVVYVDDDPVVLAHARALLVSAEPDGGSVDYVDSDARDTDYVLGEAAKTLDFSEPIAVVFGGFLGHMTTLSEACMVVRAMLEPARGGSYVIQEDGVVNRPTHAEAHNEGGPRYTARNPEEIAQYFSGLELVAPGIVPPTQWGTGPLEARYLPQVNALCGVARKP